MKIGFVRYSIFNRGGDQVVLEYAGYLAQKGYDVTIWVSRVETIFTIPPSVKIKYFSQKSKLGVIIKTIFYYFPTDVIIADIVAMASFLSFRNRGKVLYFSQGYDESYYRSLAMQKLIRLLYYYALMVRKIPVVAVSNGLGKILTSRFKAQTKVVLNGIDFRQFYPEKDEKLINKKEGRKAVLVFARKDFRKGLDIAMEVLRNIARENIRDTITVWVIGDRINIEGLHFENFGVVSQDVLRRLFSSADIFLFPTRSEGFGLMVLQAMVCGCVMVTTKAVEIAEDGGNALVSDIGDIKGLTEKLIQLLSDEGLQNRLREVAYSTARHYNIEDSKVNFERAIRSYSREKEQI